jgi:hypothetical protein
MSSSGKTGISPGYTWQQGFSCSSWEWLCSWAGYNLVATRQFVDSSNKRQIMERITKSGDQDVEKLEPSLARP